MALIFVGCGGSDTAPTPPPAQIGGIWDLRETITSVTGGECFGSLLQAAVGTTGDAVLQISQSGSSLTVRSTSPSDGGSCDYVGTASATAFVLNLSSCTSSDVIGASCPNGARRDIRVQAGSYNGSLGSGSASGTGAQTYNVFVSGTNSPVGSLTLNSRFTATRR